ncbi:10772_t:CDS:2 [Gigaspora rosea]|nr:10772_t:CDS:2 [Gigaspora rosea]
MSDEDTVHIILSTDILMKPWNLNVNNSLRFCPIDFYRNDENLIQLKSIPYYSKEIINRVIGNIDQLTLEKINKTVDLPLDQLIAPRINRLGRQRIPRPQNRFILYRRNLNAIINKRKDATSNFNFISKEAAKNWSNESNEIKQLYELLADYAKQVHKWYVFEVKEGVETIFNSN